MAFSRRNPQKCKLYGTWQGLSPKFPQFIDHYSETYLANLVKHCLNPVDVEEKLRRRPDGKPLWEELN